MRYWKPRKLPSKPLISMVVVAFERGPQLACLIYSLKSQTYTNFEVTVYHDGPMSPATLEHYRAAVGADQRFTLVENKVRQKNNGHPMRNQGLAAAKGEYVGFANDDGYYCPVYLEALVSSLLENKSDFAYCDMIHSHQQWKPIISQLKRGQIDVGNWLIKTSFARQCPPFRNEFAADYFFIEEAIKLGMRAHKVGGFYFTHN